jgi:hypothetical protein
MTDMHFFHSKHKSLRTFETRGSQEPVIAHLVFNLTSKVERKWGVTHNFESGQPKDNFHSNF